MKRGIILVILGIMFLFFMGNIIGLFLAIVALILSIINLKEKTIVNWILLIVSILSILFYIFIFVFAVSSINKLVNRAKIDSYRLHENQLTKQAEYEILTEKVIIVDENNSGYAIVNKNELDSSMSNKLPECKGYIIYNIKETHGKAYIDCGEYKTEGYNSKYLKK